MAVTTLQRRPDGRDWMDRGACIGMDPELWFPLSVTPQDGFALGRLRLAKVTCAYCPVRRECLIYAVVTGQRFGVWGGLTSKERSAPKIRQQVSQMVSQAAWMG